MIVLDTNVLSEPLRPIPDPRVSDWIDAQALETLYLSAMTMAGLRAGVALIPAGRGRTALHENSETRILPKFAGRVLPFDLACIAAAALANGFIVATRDTGPFRAARLSIINPCKEQVQARSNVTAHGGGRRGSR